MYRGSDADQQYMELANLEVYERQPSPNNRLGIRRLWGHKKYLCHSFIRRGAITYFHKFVCNSTYDFLLKGRKKKYEEITKCFISTTDVCWLFI